MPKQTLYAYATGTDHADIAEAVEARLDALVAARTWLSKDVWVVNQNEPPHWDLGLNMELAAPRTRPAAWTDDAVAVAKELAALHGQTGRTFVIGIHDPGTDVTTDVFVVDSPTPDLDALCAALAEKPAKKTRKAAT